MRVNVELNNGKEAQINRLNKPNKNFKEDENKNLDHEKLKDNNRKLVRFVKQFKEVFDKFKTAHKDIMEK